MKFFSTVWSTGVLAWVQTRKESLISILLHSQLFTATNVLDESTNLNNWAHYIGHVGQLERWYLGMLARILTKLKTTMKSMTDQCSNQILWITGCMWHPKCLYLQSASSGEKWSKFMDNSNFNGNGPIRRWQAEASAQEEKVGWKTMHTANQCATAMAFQKRGTYKCNKQTNKQTQQTNITNEQGNQLNKQTNKIAR